MLGMVLRDNPRWPGPAHSWDRPLCILEERILVHSKVETSCHCIAILLLGGARNQSFRKCDAYRHSNLHAPLNSCYTTSTVNDAVHAAFLLEER